MREIRVLPTYLVNKIAAGEVVERPASVVKELVENALDAAATAVDVTVEDGGRRLIAVRDNGVGMGPEDLKLAFASHATSKIADEEELFSIRTMGFRGEALASIAAISHAHILTRRRSDSDSPSSDAAACEVQAEGEAVHPVRPAAGAEGTTVTVRDLFFNTPARRKFLRTANTEFGHIVEAIARLALPHREVAFSLTHNGRQTHKLPAAADLRQRVADFFGAELADSLLAFADEGGGVRTCGLIAPPAQARASGRWQYFFVNSRYVRDRFLAHALREAYRGMVEPTRSPVGFVFLEMDPSQVDVNVHPAKIEVRFRNGQLVHSQLLGSVRERLNKANVPAVSIAADREESPEEDPDDARRQSLKQALADFFKSASPPQQRLRFGEQETDRPPPYPASWPARRDREQPDLDAARPAETGRPFTGASAPAPTSESPGQDQSRFGPAFAAAARRDAIQLHNSYIVTGDEDGLVIIDQHALHERIIFEDLSRRIATGNLTAQRLLIPETVEVGQPDKAVLTERADLLARLGIEVSEFGPNSVAVHSFPALLAERQVPVAGWMRDLLDLLAEHASADGGELLTHALAAMACGAAVKAGDPLTDEEIDALLARRSQVQQAASCPHGRPTTLMLTLAQLEKQFKRS